MEAEPSQTLLRYCCGVAVPVRVTEWDWFVFREAGFDKWVWHVHMFWDLCAPLWKYLHALADLLHADLIPLHSCFEPWPV